MTGIIWTRVYSYSINPKPDIMFYVSSRSRRPITSGSTPLLSKVSRLLPTEDCDQMCVCVWRLCVHGKVYLVEVGCIKLKK